MLCGKGNDLLVMHAMWKGECFAGDACYVERGMICWVRSIFSATINSLSRVQYLVE